MQYRNVRGNRWEREDLLVSPKRPLAQRHFAVGYLVIDRSANACPSGSSTGVGIALLCTDRGYHHGGERHAKPPFTTVACFSSGAEGIRTPDLRRAKAASYFAGPFWSLQNSCKYACYSNNAFPEFLGHLLRLLHRFRKNKTGKTTTNPVREAEQDARQLVRRNR
jgi:hypothetical protein